MLELGAKPNDIVYANPCKQSSHLLYAAKKSVSRIVFDCKGELDKIKKLHPSSE